MEQVIEVVRLHTSRDRVGGGIDGNNCSIWQISHEMNMDDALKDGIEDTTSGLPRGAGTWTQYYGNAANVVGGQSRINYGGKTNPGNSTPCPTGLRKSQELVTFLLHSLNGSK